MPTDVMTVYTCDICFRRGGTSELPDGWISYREEFIFHHPFNYQPGKPLDPEPPHQFVICRECWPIFMGALRIKP